jgi:hypothetical protein
MTSESYNAVHQRLRRARGRASEHGCAVPACDRQANVWAWQRTGPSRSGLQGHVRVTWGLDPDDYVPMCRSHSAMLDHGGTLTHCPSGHVRAEVGRIRNGRCRACYEGDLRAWRES